MANPITEPLCYKIFRYGIKQTVSLIEIENIRNIWAINKHFYSGSILFLRSNEPCKSIAGPVLLLLLCIASIFVHIFLSVFCSSEVKKKYLLNLYAASSQCLCLLAFLLIQFHFKVLIMVSQLALQ